ncbi:hypothetical protein EOS_35875 [Caballeronia mineralivorans PML1(12)]|uniref:Type VI secretion protein n=1 Tax=Caballeronia mineralivorans PML1(12) TaxID=908627 RepID=A0A0J1CL68_9BURK|nr:type VI secretion system baseplate subunit TssG [Caballeronia mineralivorans]KLU21467.1 hypothetical protein EOS_35875 [Caballeronia mineralivorans PML1(12)]
MAAEDRTPAPVVGRSPPGFGLMPGLQAEGARYGLFQALRLMRMGFPSDAAFHTGVRVQPNLSLAFPENDVERISVDDDGRWRIVANFFGLYGVSSPLPTFYTEDLIDEARNGRSATRELLDIVHATLYPMLFNAWEKYRIWIAVSERGDQRRLDQLYALIGAMGYASSEQPETRLLRFAGIFNQFPRSALGLETLVRGLLDGAQVAVEPCVVRVVPIPLEARCELGAPGACLGDTLIGTQIAQRSGTTLIRVGPVDARRFDTLLPGGAAYASLARDLALYLHDPVRCELELTLAPDELEPAQLGAEQWGRLGLDMWLAGDAAADPRVRAPAVRFELPLSTDSHPLQQGATV